MSMLLLRMAKRKHPEVEDESKPWLLSPHPQVVACFVDDIDIDCCI